MIVAEMYCFGARGIFQRHTQDFFFYEFYPHFNKLNIFHLIYSFIAITRTALSP